MELDNFILKEYDKENIEHCNVIDTLDIDEKTQKFVGRTRTLIQIINKRKEEEDYLHNNTYIAYYNDRPVGYISLTHKEDNYEVISGLLKEERNQHLGSLLLLEFSEKIFEEYKDIDKLTLKINSKNIGSIKCAELVGYKNEERDKYIMRR